MNMRKILYLLFMVFILHGVASAQTPYWNESFDNPQGWSLDENWNIANGKLRFNWSPTITNFDLSAVSSVVSLMDNTQELIVVQYLDAFGFGSPPEVAEIIIMKDGDEEVLWSYTLDDGNWGQQNGTELILDISAYGGSDVQFKFRTYGPTTYNWNWWDIFEMQLTTLLDNDLTVKQISGPAVLDAQETGIWQLTVKNLGSQPQSGFDVNLYSYKFGELIGNMQIQDVVDPQQASAYEFEWTPDTSQNTALFGEVILEGDEFSDNNKSISHFVRVRPDLEIKILVWDNDNGIETITDPEMGDVIQPSTALMRVLDAAGLDYDYVSGIPDDLFSYDMVFATMGCYCVS